MYLITLVSITCKFGALLKLIAFKEDLKNGKTISYLVIKSAFRPYLADRAFSPMLAEGIYFLQCLWRQMGKPESNIYFVPKLFQEIPCSGDRIRGSNCVKGLM